jgi:Zn-finger nucleic acid-binding protein
MVTFDNTYRGHQCNKCKGLLLTRSTFRLTVETRRASATTAPDAPKPLNREELNRKLDCPRCNQKMMTHPYMGPGTIVIDTCDHCNIIWLDYGELGRVINAPGKDRGTGLGQVIDRLQDEKKIKKQKKKKTQYDKDLIELLDKIF